MQIPFNRISREAQPFEVTHGAVRIEGVLQLYRPKLLLLKATMRGPLNVECYRCGTPFDIMLDENVSFLLSDGVYRGQDDEYDVVEVEEGMIDLDAIFDSEIAMIESDYHSCEKCNAEAEAGMTLF